MRSALLERGDMPRGIASIMPHPRASLGRWNMPWLGTIKGEGRNGRRVASLLLTDIVGSTRTAASLGHARWAELLLLHDARTRAQVERHGGEVIELTGDGMVAAFDRVGVALECASALHQALHALGLSIRAAVHVGEVEVCGPRVIGLAVHIVARIANLAGPGETLVSSAVRELAENAQAAFVDRGEHALKGVPEPCRVFSLVSLQ